MDWNNICRTCLTTNNTLESIYSSPDPLALEYEYSASYSNMIKSVTSLSIAPNDTLPQHICQKCINGLLIAFNFQKLAAKTEEALKSQRTPEIKILPDPLSIDCHYTDVGDVEVEILNPNKSDLKCVIVQKQNESKIKVKCPTLTHNIDKLRQQIEEDKNESENKTNEKPKKQSAKNNIKKTKTLQSIKPKPQEIKILPDPLLSTDYHMDIADEILTPNTSDLKCDIVQKQIENKIIVKDPILTYNIDKIRQQIGKAIYRKIEIKNKTKETPIKQSTKNNIKKTKTLQPIKPKLQEIKIKSVQSLQEQPNIKTVQLDKSLSGNHVLAPWVSPPPLVFLSDSKTTPPPLFFLPNKVTTEICKYCDMKFATEFDFKVHLLTHEINLNTVSNCHFCWETPKDLLRHLKEHYKFTTCAQCKIKFDSITNFENHMKEHSLAKNIICPIVKKNPIYLCRICERNTNINENICHFCKNREKHICRTCGKEFIDFNLFVQHERKH